MKDKSKYFEAGVGAKTGKLKKFKEIY